MIDCPDGDELFLLLDGEATENRGAELRAHLASCPACPKELEAQRQLIARIAAPLEGLPSPGAASAVLRRLDERKLARPATRRPRWALGAAGLAACAAIALVVLPRAPTTPTGFASRGGAAGWAGKVGVELLALGAPPRGLAAGSPVTPGTAFVASYRNLGDARVFLTLFAIDAGGEVRWLYPAFVDRGADPGSVLLPKAVSPQLFPDSVAFDDLPPGALRVITILSREPLRASSVEQLSAADRSLDRLRARWADAVIDELALRVAPPPTPTPEPKR